jgi:predicted peptidase
MQKYFFVCCLLIASGGAFSQNRQLFERQLFIQQDDTLRCRILSPINFNDKKKYPLIIFMYGSGER